MFEGSCEMGRRWTRRRWMGRRWMGLIAIGQMSTWVLTVGPPPASVQTAGATATDAPPAASAQTAQAAEAVRAREVAFAATMADRDMEAFLAFISPEAVFFTGDRPLRGRDAVTEAWAPFFEGSTAPFSWAPDVVEVLESGSLALSSGPVLDPDGNEIGRFNTVWRLDADGRWRVVFDKGS